MAEIMSSLTRLFDIGAERFLWIQQTHIHNLPLLSLFAAFFIQFFVMAQQLQEEQPVFSEGILASFDNFIARVDRVLYERFFAPFLRKPPSPPPDTAPVPAAPPEQPPPVSPLGQASSFSLGKHTRCEALASALRRTRSRVERATVLSSSFGPTTTTTTAAHSPEPLRSAAVKQTSLTPARPALCPSVRLQHHAAVTFGDRLHGDCLITSVEFNASGDLLAATGVTKQIAVYDAQVILAAPHAPHVPILKLPCSAKPTCLSWDRTGAHTLASSDAEGTVSVWDVARAATGCPPARTLKAHPSRVWSLQYSPLCPGRLVTGSDEARARVWEANAPEAVCTIKAPANVCCVAWDPVSAFHLALGLADHRALYFDLRRPDVALFAMTGHRRAVSFLRFLPHSSDFITASIDSSLRLWSTSTGACQQVFTGHTNTKNFTGLAVAEGRIAVGSETNRVVVYDPHKPTPVQECPMERAVNQPVCDIMSEWDSLTPPKSAFVSSLCWHPFKPLLAAANNQSLINFYVAPCPEEIARS
ncbi:putative E3 ubiquitin-protein ligase COP1 [Paratrimastix pyriformis]|uniref:E3 ubiquitin-protein ligase COP1 n=1 Tax=Paratrimastix pyriformis TaxID=342808 RepID=A0ABQ8UBL6_9EUKA|nr:putative E3 ubiquitin-protein ligase COP1 [Paratrimastix pyriformis]